MKFSSAVWAFGLAAGCFVLTLSTQAEGVAHAKAAAAVKKAPAEAAVGKKAEGKHRLAGRAILPNGRTSGILTEAYGLMEHADRDYKGHRALAMRHVKQAAELIGQRVGARRGGHEAQGSSDEQLRQAESLLREASGSLSGMPLQHVHTALQELSVALAVR
ncbi:MAG TPA: hypothetical protein VGO59_04145 [Verrucomicrobiae bacterium]|jgi:hypothetical protein